MKKTLTLLLFCFFTSGMLIAQDEQPATPVVGTFSSARIINLQSTEVWGKKVLGYTISHRFGELGTGFEGFFGMDAGATIHFSIDYGITEKLMLGIGRQNQHKLIDGYAKYALMQQTQGGEIPLNVTLYGKANLTTEKGEIPGTDIDIYDNIAHRYSYITQAIISRKFGETFSFQLSPTYVHFNLVETEEEQNNIFAAGLAAKYRLSRKSTITAEYTYTFGDYAPNVPVEPHTVGLAWNIETGGHVFQLSATNAYYINDVYLMGRNTSPLDLDRWHIGFNIVRKFNL